MRNKLLTEAQRNLRNKILKLRDEIFYAEIQINELQKQCPHEFVHYPNPDVQVKYCIICGYEKYK